MSFVVDVIDDCVVVIRVLAGIKTSDWPAYRAAYMKVYDTFDHFVIVFDLREVTMSNVDLIPLKKELIQELKPRTTRQVLGVVVVTAYDVIATLVTTLVRQGGQAAPFFISTNLHEAASVASRMANIIKRVPGCDAEERGVVTYGELSKAAFTVLIFFMFVRMQNHFLRAAAATAASRR
jgi:hypothetical protein